MNECKNLSKPRRDVYQFIRLLISFSCEPSKFSYEVVTMIIALVTTKEKLFGTNSDYVRNWATGT